MANLSATVINNHAGLNPITSLVAAAGGGDNFPCGAHVFAYFKTAGTAITATVAIPGSGPTGVANPDNAISLPATGDRWVPMPSFYADTDGLAHVTYSPSATGLTVGAFVTA